MQVSVRSYLTAGVALAGATVIAVSPVAPPLPDIHVPTATSVAMDLTAAMSPFDPYVQLVQNTATSIQGLVTQFLTPSPAPILQQLIANQITSVSTLTNAVLQVVPQVVAGLAAMPQVLHDTFTLIGQGDVAGAANTLELGILGNVLFPFFGLFGPIQQVIAQPLQNLTNVANQFSAIAASVGVAVLLPVFNPVQAVANAIQGVIDAAQTGGPGAIVNALIGAPAVALDQILNGVESPNQLAGFLTPSAVAGGGLFATVLDVREIIAEAIGYVPPASAAATRSAAANGGVVATPKRVASAAATTTKDNSTGGGTEVNNDSASSGSTITTKSDSSSKGGRSSASGGSSSPKSAKHSGVGGSKRAAAKAGSGSAS